MENYSLKENRIVAFIYIEGKFYSHEFHTECVTKYLISKGLISKDEELYKMLNNKKHKHIAQKWVEQIEENCIFGELANYKKERSLIIFDPLTDYGKERIKEKGFETFGVKKFYYARYMGSSNAKFSFIEF